MNTQSALPVDTLVETTARGLAEISGNIFAALAQDYDERRRLDQQEKHRCAVGLINGAIESKRRLALEDIAPFVLGATCMTRSEIATKLGLSLTHFNAGVKSWYHIF